MVPKSNKVGQLTRRQGVPLQDVLLLLPLLIFKLLALCDSLPLALTVDSNGIFHSPYDIVFPFPFFMTPFSSLHSAQLGVSPLPMCSPIMDIVARNKGMRKVNQTL